MLFAGECIHALADGSETTTAEAGAMLLAELVSIAREFRDAYAQAGQQQQRQQRRSRLRR